MAFPPRRKRPIHESASAYARCRGPPGASNLAWRGGAIEALLPLLAFLDIGLSSGVSLDA
jgi:hypothetical protein